MAANDQLRDSALRHAAYLAKFGEGLADKVVTLLNSADKDIAAKLAAALSSELTEKRLGELLEEVRLLSGTVYGGATDLLDTELTKVAETSAEYESGALNDAIPLNQYRASLPAPAKIAALATTSPIDGYLLKSWTDNMSANRLARVEKELRVGMVQGETIDQLVRRVMGTKANGYKDGVLDISRRSARSLAITANATIASRAREETHKANARVIKSVMWLATLDTRTSTICQSRDGQTWALDEPHPSTPAHIRCRSLLVPITKRFDELGIARKDIDPATRASMDGQVPAKTTYGDWLGKQSEARQDDILGKQRADLFRSGKLPFKDLYRQDGSYKTVEELRSKLGLPMPEKAPERLVAVPQPATGAFNPINPLVTDASIETTPRLKAQKKLDTMLAVGANDARHEAIAEFSKTKGKGWGKSTFPADMTDECASMIVAIHPELDAMADRFKIPRLRAYRAVSGHSVMGNMGDGSMGVNPTYFNAFAAKVGGKKADDLIDELAGKRDALKGEINDLRSKLDDVKAKLREVGTSDPRWLTLYDDYDATAKLYNGKIKLYNTASKKAAATARKGVDIASSWKPGDDVEGRPFNAADYFTGIDRARNVLYHEFAHHVHQMMNKTQRRGRGYKPPLEIELRGYWLDTFRNVKPETRTKRDRQASKYSLTNEHEWFAENFSLFMMGRRDLTDPDAIKLIERLLNETA